MKYPYGCKVSIPYENEHGDAAYFDVSLNSPVDHRRVKRILRTILRRSGLRSCDRTIRLLMTRFLIRFRPINPDDFEKFISYMEAPE